MMTHPLSTFGMRICFPLSGKAQEHWGGRAGTVQGQTAGQVRPDLSAVGSCGNVLNIVTDRAWTAGNRVLQ